ncbi:MAG: PQQ-binding-like beta-propeller repeat protein, partial [candidate division Zixibacteria bacterium]
MSRNLFKKSVTLILLVALSSLMSCSTERVPSGTLLWKHQIGAELWSPTKYDHGLLYFGSDDSNFYALDVDDQRVEWQFETGGIIRSGADISSGVVTFASDDGFLYALDAKSGKELWQFDLGSSDFLRRGPAPDAPYRYDYMHSSPAVHRSILYIGSADGSMYAINHKSGDEIWRFATDSIVRSTPLVHDGTIYFGSWDGK